MWTSSEIKHLTKVPIGAADEAIKSIRLLALTGKQLFSKYLIEPLHFAGWERSAVKETLKKLRERINQACDDPGAVHTAGPLGKRLVSLALAENFSAVGDSSIFFLEKMMSKTAVAVSKEALEFFNIIFPPLSEFKKMHANKSENIFTENLNSLDAEELKRALEPVPLGRIQTDVKLKQEAVILFEQIKAANSRNDMHRCRKLIATYLIRYADQEDNNRDEVERLIDAFQKRELTFRRELKEAMAIKLYFLIIGAITKSDLKQAIRGIRKYAFIFQGDPDIPYYNEIDNLERKLYEIINEKGLMQELKRI